MRLICTTFLNYKVSRQPCCNEKYRQYRDRKVKDLIIEEGGKVHLSIQGRVFLAKFARKTRQKSLRPSSWRSARDRKVHLTSCNPELIWLAIMCC